MPNTGSKILTKTDVPDINGAVKRGRGRSSVHEALLAGRVRAHERHHVANAEAHVGEAAGEDLDLAVGIREQPVGGDVFRRLAADICADDWSAWTCELRRSGKPIAVSNYQGSGRTTPRAPAS